MVGKDRMKSHSGRTGVNQGLLNLTFYLLVLLLTWFYGLTGNVCKENNDVHMYSEIILEVTFMA